MIIKATKACVSKEIKQDDYSRAIGKSKETLEDLVAKIEALTHRVVKAINYAEKKQKVRKVKGYYSFPTC